MSPRVGSGKGAKHYPYTKKGMEEAMEEAHRTGKPMMKPKPKGRKGTKK